MVGHGVEGRCHLRRHEREFLELVCRHLHAGGRRHYVGDLGGGQRDLAAQGAHVALGLAVHLGELAHFIACTRHLSGDTQHGVLVLRVAAHRPHADFHTARAGGLHRHPGACGYAGLQHGLGVLVAQSLQVLLLLGQALQLGALPCHGAGRVVDVGFQARLCGAQATGDTHGIERRPRFPRCRAL